MGWWVASLVTPEKTGGVPTLAENAFPPGSRKGGLVLIRAHAYGEIVPYPSARRRQLSQTATKQAQPSPPFPQVDSPRVSLVRDDGSTTKGAIILRPFNSAAEQEPSLSP